jgi:DNA-binding winged helix-turn-helix (wHTH) protein
MPAQMNRFKSVTTLSLPEGFAAATGNPACDQHAVQPTCFGQPWLLLPNSPAPGTESDTAALDMSAWQVHPQLNMIQTSAAAMRTIRRQLEPRVMHLLCLLAAADGNVVTRDELMMALWPKVIVNENSLTRAVSELRKALSIPTQAETDTVRSTAIETVSKRGYRLNASLRFGEIAPDMSQQPRNTSAPSANVGAGHFGSVWLATHPRMTVAICTAFATAVLSLVLSSVFFVSTDPARWLASIPAVDSQGGSGSLSDRVVSDGPALPTGVQWLNSLHIPAGTADLESAPWLNPDTGNNTSLSILSPGGDLLAFVENLSGQSTLKLRSLNNPDEIWTAFTSTAPITHVQWSPLEHGILFTVVDQQQPAPAALTDSPKIAAYPLARLMLLDLHSLQVRELYRRENTDTVEPASSAGSLT